MRCPGEGIWPKFHRALASGKQSGATAGWKQGRSHSILELEGLSGLVTHPPSMDPKHQPGVRSSSMSSLVSWDYGT
jgi:hypothetical protein